MMPFIITASFPSYASGRRVGFYLLV